MTGENHTKYEILKNKQSANCLFFLLSYEQRRRVVNHLRCIIQQSDKFSK
jgi:hypothetical protein